MPRHGHGASPRHDVMPKRARLAPKINPKFSHKMYETVVKNYNNLYLTFYVTVYIDKLLCSNIRHTISLDPET